MGVPYEPSSYVNVGDGGGTGEVTLSGTDDSSHTGSVFSIKSGYDSNIVAKVGEDGSVTIDVYYV